VALRIVLADDHAQIRRAFRRLLEAEAGWLVCGEAADGEEALSLCAALRPDAVLLDISMPRLGGLETARRLRESAPDIAVLIVSLHGEEAVAAAALDAGARGFVSKSEAHQRLVPAIRTLFQAKAKQVPARGGR